MRTFIAALAMVLTAAIMIPAAAQRNGRKPAAKPAGSTGKEAGAKVKVTLGRSSFSGGPISKADFDAYSKQGLLAASGKVTDFFFTYAERNLYEDSVGNPIVVTELLTETSYGPQFSPGISGTIYDRTKPGDTAFFENIRLTMPNGATGFGEDMKFWITR